MSKNSSTPAQRSYIESLLKKNGIIKREDQMAHLNEFFKYNGNREWGYTETMNQALSRLTKTVASKIINDLSQVNDADKGEGK